MNLILLYRNHYSDRFYSADKYFEGEETLSRLMKEYPHSFFFIFNDDGDYHNSTVIPRPQIRRMFEVDNKNQYKCPKCRTKNHVTREACRNCWYENKYQSVLKYLDNKISKAAELRQFVEHDFWYHNDRA